MSVLKIFRFRQMFVINSNMFTRWIMIPPFLIPVLYLILRHFLSLTHPQHVIAPIGRHHYPDCKHRLHMIARIQRLESLPLTQDEADTSDES